MTASPAGSLAVTGTVAHALLSGGLWRGLRSAEELAIVGLAAAAYALYRLLPANRTPVGHSPADHARAARIVAEHAQDSLDPFALRSDKAFHFAYDGLLAYRAVGSTAVVSGDPVGPPGTHAAILRDFERQAARHGWDVVMTAASARHLKDYRTLGFHTMRIGEEAVVDPAAFTLDGRPRKSLRKAVRRVAREGWTIDVVEADALDDATVAELAAVERTWRARQPRLVGFAMCLGRLWGAEEDAGAVYVLARDPAGRLHGFLRFATYPGGLSLDAMRRLVDRPNGVTEAMVVAGLEDARAQGIAEVSLNFAGFSHLLLPRESLTRPQRVARGVLGLLHGRFQLDRLAVFDKRFGSEWRPRHLVWRRALSLPRAGLRVLQAEAYVAAPPVVRLPGRWEANDRPVGSATSS